MFCKALLTHGAKKYPEAQQSFLAVVQMFPNNQAAVEGLARAFYLDGNRQQALAVLNETSEISISRRQSGRGSRR